jgi:hypothetical protein
MKREMHGSYSGLSAKFVCIYKASFLSQEYSLRGKKTFNSLSWI